MIIIETSPDTQDAIILMDELSEALEFITPTKEQSIRRIVGMLMIPLLLDLKDSNAFFILSTPILLSMVLTSHYMP